MGTLGNNTDGKIEGVCRTYFSTGEGEYLKELLQNPKERDIHEKLKEEDAKKLYKRAKDLMAKVELNLIPAGQMPKVERKITHLLAAIDGLHVVKSLEKVADEDAYTNEDKDSYTM